MFNVAVQGNNQGVRSMHLAGDQALVTVCVLHVIK